MNPKINFKITHNILIEKAFSRDTFLRSERCKNIIYKLGILLFSLPELEIMLKFLPELSVYFVL